MKKLEASFFQEEKGKAGARLRDCPQTAFARGNKDFCLEGLLRILIHNQILLKVAFDSS